MRDSFFTKFGVIAVVLVAFIDGILVANHYNQRIDNTQAHLAVELENIFALYEEELYEQEPIIEETIEEPSFIEIHDVPFTSQAPAGDWKSPWSDYAEEAVMTMLSKWWDNEESINVEQAELSMLAIGEYEAELFGDSLLANIVQIQIVLNDLFGIPSEIMNFPTISELREALDAGSIIIVPVNGQILLNPHYGDPAPEHHIILIHGWEESHFIAHDPGTIRGENVYYDQEKILESIQDIAGELRVLIIKP